MTLTVSGQYFIVQKSAADVSNALEKWVFPVIGLPSIIQSDNGHEFVNSLTRET